MPTTRRNASQFVQGAGARTVRAHHAACVVLLLAFASGCVSPPDPPPAARGSVVASVDQPSPTQEPSKPELTDGRDIYVVNPKTGDATAFLSARGSQTNAELSPDGRRVVYESRAPGDPSQIFVMDSDGATRKLTNMRRGASDPTWSPDGTQIAFAGTRPGEGHHMDTDIFVMNARGGHIRRLAGTHELDADPDWSPDGSRVAFQSGSNFQSWDGPGDYSQIWLASVPGGALTQLRLRYLPFGGDPAWSPDGRWIAFSRFAPREFIGQYPAGLLAIRPDGSGQHQLEELENDHWRLSPSWSPDGRWIIVQEDGHLQVIHVKSGKVRTLLTDVFHGQPSWGHDGILVSM